jgi:outer membrane protein TolC
MRKLILFLLTCVPLGLSAQSTWTLKKCVEYGLKNHRSNVVYANEKRAADAKAKEALAAYLPSVSIIGALDDNLKVQETVIPAGLFGPNDIRVAFTKQFSTNGYVQLDQTLYDQALITGLKANKYNTRQAELNVAQNEESIIYNVSNNFFQVLVYREQLNLLTDNLQKYLAQMSITELQVKKGITLQKDLDKVTVDYNNAISQIHVAESNLTLSENQLKYDMGYPITDSLLIDSVAAGNALDIPKPALADTGFFLANNRTEYRISQVQEKMLEIDEKRIKAEGLPKLSTYARYGSNGFGDQLKGAFSSMATYSTVGLKLNFPILDFFKRNAQYKQAQYKRLNAIENLKLDEGKYLLEYENARTKLIKEQTNVANNRRNIALATSVFNVTDLQYQKGTTDMTDWLNAQHSLKEALNNYLNSLYSYFQAKVNLEKAGGTLKNFYSTL